MWTANQTPYFSMRDRDVRGLTNSLMMSLPAYNRFISPTNSLNDTTYRSVLISMKDPTNDKHVQKVIKDAKATFNAKESNGIKIFNFYDDQETTETVE